MQAFVCACALSSAALRGAASATCGSWAGTGGRMVQRRSSMAKCCHNFLASQERDLVVSYLLSAAAACDRMHCRADSEQSYV